MGIAGLLDESLANILRLSGWSNPVHSRGWDESNSRRSGSCTRLPDPGDSVRVEVRVGTDYRYPLELGLSYEEAIKRVTMVPRQTGLTLGVVERNREQDEP